MKIRSFQLFTVISILSGLLGALAGCGGGTAGNSSPVVASASSKECTGCHAANSKSISPTSGVRIAFAWQSSAHNTHNGAGCLDCHSYAHYHDNSVNCRSCHATAHSNNGNSCSLCHGGSSSSVTNCLSCHATAHKDPNSCNRCHGGEVPVDVALKNPDTAGKCWGCHRTAFLVRHESTGAPAAVKAAHFKNITSFRSQYINLTSVDSFTCTRCHEPHNPGSGRGAAERKAWAQSGHGTVDPVKGVAWKPGATHKWLITGSSVNFSQTIPTSDCLRCHTADGFVQFTNSNFTSVANLKGDPKVNAPLKCGACHNNDSFSVRGVSAVSTFYNVNITDKVTAKNVQSRRAATFPDVGQSNICIACHSGRVVGPNLTEMFAGGNWDLSNASFQNSHYMAAAGTMYLTVGFKNFTGLNSPVATNNEGSALTFLPATKTYNLLNTAATTGKGGVGTTSNLGIAGGVTSSHRMLGTPSVASSQDYLKPPTKQTALSTNGPCITCHMKAYEPVPGNGFTPPAAGRPANGHSLKIDEATAQELCLQCHGDAPHLDGGDGNGNGIYTSMKTLADMTHAMLEPQSSAFQKGMTLIKQLLLVKYMIKYNPTAYPYFYDLQKDATGKTAITDWTRKNVAGVTDAVVTALGNARITVIPAGGLTQLQAYRLMGACYNLNVLFRDPGSFVHARTYSQRVVYDTVDYLDNTKMDFTSLSSARAMTAAGVTDLVGIYTGYDVNVLNPTPGATGGVTTLAGRGLATESIAWLSGTHYTDSKGTTPIPMKLHP